MPQKAFRFLHSSDLHLDRPLQGLGELPEQLRDLAIDAPYGAAAKIFETALAEEVAFVILAGDVLDVRYTGPRGPLFLIEQCERLAAAEIPVYWALSPSEPPDAWPDVLPLPGNVHRFPVHRLTEHLVERGGEPLARVIGTSRDGSRPLRPSEFSADASGLYTVAAVYGEAETAALHARGVHYWALGGRHDRSTSLSGALLAHYPGTPQGRGPGEAGSRGCALVSVEKDAARAAAVATNVAAWHGERVLIDEDTSIEQLRERLRDRVEALGAGVGGIDLLVSWTITGHGPLLTSLRRGGAGEVLTWLRHEFGMSRPAVWSVSLEVEPTAALPVEWYEQETIRGDYLRVLRQFEINADQSLDLEQYLAEEHASGTLGAIAALEGTERIAVLREAALLGVDLLSGEESNG